MNTTGRETDVCVVGGGPAGMLLALLLAKMGVKVLVLEQHKDFEREYRGEVLMPRFSQMMRQLGLFEELESKCHHLKLEGVEGFYRGKSFVRILLKEISPEVPFALWMPQPILLNFLYEKAKPFRHYDVLFNTSAKALIEQDGKIKGVLAQNDLGEKIEIRAKVTVGADGRFSVVRRLGGFELEDEDYHFDIVWFSIPRPEGFDHQVRFFVNQEQNFLILPKYPDLIQCGLIVPKGGYAVLRHEGIEAMRKRLIRAHRLFRTFAEKLKDFSPFNVLQARIEYVKRWARDGALLVGDSAHTCSPAGAIGVSVAAASALAASEVIFQALASKDVSARSLGKLQSMREDEVKMIQKNQKAFARLLLGSSGLFSFLMPMQLMLAAKLGLLKAAQRKLLVQEKPLPVRVSFQN